MTMTDFIAFLRRHCAESIKEGAHILTEDSGKNHAYEDVRGLIDAFLKGYAEQKKLTKQAEKAFLEAIENDARRQFDDPVELIEHIQEIASRPPFFDSERISLTAISGFCNDFTHRHKINVREELLKQAPF